MQKSVNLMVLVCCNLLWKYLRWLLIKIMRKIKLIHLKVYLHISGWLWQFYHAKCWQIKLQKETESSSKWSVILLFDNSFENRFNSTFVTGAILKLSETVIVKSKEIFAKSSMIFVVVGFPLLRYIRISPTIKHDKNH